MSAFNIKILIAVFLFSSINACSDSSSTPSDSGPPRETSVKNEAGTGDGAQVSCPKDFPEQFEGVCLMQKPTTEGKRTQCGEIVDDCDKGSTSTPNLACITAAPPAKPSGKTSVTLAGYIDVFSSGPDADGIVIEVYDSVELIKAIEAERKAGTLKTKTFPTSIKALGTDTVTLTWTDKNKVPEDAVRGKARACPKDKKLKLACAPPTADCTLCDMSAGNYCYEKQCVERLRWESRFRIPNIDTNRYLALRTRGQGGFSDGTWGIMVQFNVYLRADAPACTTGQVNDCINSKGEYELEINALSKSDYTTIPITAGLSGGVPEGHGAIAGEVHDCDDIKLSNFHVGTNPTPTVLTYFNGNPISTLPDLGRQTFGTNIDGIFSALDIIPGKVSVGAAGLANSKTVSAGTLEVAVLPDSVTVVTFEGKKPSP